MPITYVDAAVIYELHDAVLRATGGRPGILDAGKVESAAALPRQFVFGVEPYPTIEAKASCYAFHIAKGHAFEDGNKRTAVEVMQVFLDLNYYKIDATGAELTEVILSVAEGTLAKDELTDWIRQRLVAAYPRSETEPEMADS